MRNLFLIAFLLIGIISHAQKVKISCPPKTKLKKDLSFGYLNMRGAQLGEIYSVKISRNGKIKRMNYIGAKAVEKENIKDGILVKQKEYATEIEFSLSASTDIDPTLLAKLKNDLTKEMTFNLFNSKPYSIFDPSEQVEYFDPNIFPIKSNEIYILINRITVADSLVILTNRGLDISASSSIKMSDYDVEIVNNCKGILRIIGKEVPTFFEFIAFKPKIYKEEKFVVGLTGENKSKSVKVKVAKWEQIPDIELADDFEY